MKVLTIVFADYSRLHHAQEPVKHRSVSIELTEKQLDQIKPRITHQNYGKNIYEDISMCFIEDKG